MKTLSEQWGSEVKFTQSLASNIDDLNKITELVGLPKIKRAIYEYQIKGGLIDVVGFTSNNKTVIFEHQDKTGKADQTHVSKTMTYAHQLALQGSEVLGAILLCEEVDDHYIEQYANVRKENRYNGIYNLHIIKSQWSDCGEYIPIAFSEDNINVRKQSRPIAQYQDFVNKYGREWKILGEELRETSVTLWFRDSTRGNHYIHRTKRTIKVGVHFDKPTTEEKDKVSAHQNGRHSQNRSTIEIDCGKSATDYECWLEAEKIKQYLRT